MSATKTIKLTIPQGIQDVTLGQYLNFCALRRQIHQDEKEGNPWLPRRYARHILSVFSGVDPITLGEVDEDQFQAAFSRLTFIAQLGTLKPRGEYTGGTFIVKGESFALPDSLDHMTAGQYEVIEKTLRDSSTFERLHYVLAILSMDVPNILSMENELHRRAQLFADELPLMDCYDLLFFCPNGSGTQSIATQCFMKEVKIKKGL